MHISILRVIDSNSLQLNYRKLKALKFISIIHDLGENAPHIAVKFAINLYSEHLIHYGGACSSRISYHVDVCTSIYMLKRFHALVSLFQWKVEAQLEVYRSEKVLDLCLF